MGKPLIDQLLQRLALAGGVSELGRSVRALPEQAGLAGPRGCGGVFVASGESQPCLRVNSKPHVCVSMIER